MLLSVVELDRPVEDAAGLLSFLPYWERGALSHGLIAIDSLPTIVRGPFECSQPTNNTVWTYLDLWPVAVHAGKKKPGHAVISIKVDITEMHKLLYIWVIFISLVYL